MRKIIVAGSMNMDLVFSVDKLPQKGETLIGKGFIMNPGGKGANQATCCAKLNSNAYMIGNVGDDILGASLIDTLKDSGVNTTFVKKIKNSTTGVAGIIVLDGDNRIILDSAANDSVGYEQIENVLDDIAEPKDIFLTQFEIPYQSVMLGLRKAKSKGMITILNPAPAFKIEDDYYDYIDIIIPNEIEAEMITGVNRTDQDFSSKVIDYFLSKGVKEVILTLGKEGAVYGKKGLYKTFPAWEVEVIDSTAAGDTFVGTVAAELAKGSLIGNVITKATAAAAITVSRLGAQNAIPCENEIATFMSRKEKH